MGKKGIGNIRNKEENQNLSSKSRSRSSAPAKGSFVVKKVCQVTKTAKETYVSGPQQHA
jgi:hypothetical protein